jgi:hypothetical protein
MLGVILVRGEVGFDYTVMGLPASQSGAEATGLDVETYPASAFDPVQDEVAWKLMHRQFSFAGVNYANHRSPGSHAYYFSSPLWPFVVLTSIMPLALIFRQRRARRRRLRQLCQVCGYDLRASGGICPECGTTRVPPSVGGNP